ncbi:MAG TPA: ChbG/HpnK family deacetylase [Caulobacteraceae bacterium]|jgi:hypothetical protein|nr:ChbG/HpnK family deacetylase [Caulobacteraceae bacterium]
MQTATLAERLGYAADDRLLIVNCDDLGSSHAANVAVEAALRRGFATSATLMVPCPWAFAAAKACADLDIGVHLTLTAEYPGYRWRSLTGAASLHDADGFLPRTTEEVYAHADPADARAECRAQIDQALGWGLDVTHLDSHMGSVQTDARFFEIYADLAAEYRLPLRMAGARAEPVLGFAFRRPAAERGCVFPDHLLAPPWAKATRPVLLDNLARLRPGVTETFLHPAEDGPELRAYDRSAPDTRAGDYANLMDGELAALIEAEGVRLISFRPLRELQRAA